jgi:TonB family protein
MNVSSFLLALILATAVGVVPASAQNENADLGASRKVVSKIMPTYPSIARSMNLSGSVKLEVLVSPNGSVKSIQVLGGNPVFSQAAEFAVRGWKWEKNEHESTERVEVRFNP